MSQAAIEFFLGVGAFVAGLGAFSMITRRVVPKKNPKDISAAIDLLEPVAPYVLIVGLIMLLIGGIGLLFE